LSYAGKGKTITKLLVFLNVLKKIKFFTPHPSLFCDKII